MKPGTSRHARPTKRDSKQRKTVDPAEAFCAGVKAALDRGEPDAISDEVLRKVLTSAVKLYAAKMDGMVEEIPPFLENQVTATETVVASCAMIRSAGLNLFDVAMWFRRSSGGL
jgi:hypothetical protein